MAEILLLGGAAVAAAAVSSLLESKKPALYTLTPPVFDRSLTEDSLTLTPLESWSTPRRALFFRHYTGGGMDAGQHVSENLLDMRIHMAPQSTLGEKHDFMAHVYLPRTGAGAGGAHGQQGTRPLAEARFHVQHKLDPNSFSNFCLRTEQGGNAYFNGAYNLTSARDRVRAARCPGYVAVPQRPGEPQGTSLFFNLPLFRRPAAAYAMGSLDALAEGSRGPFFQQRHLLRTGGVIGLRYDRGQAESVVVDSTTNNANASAVVTPPEEKGTMSSKYQSYVAAAKNATQSAKDAATAAAVKAKESYPNLPLPSSVTPPATTSVFTFKPKSNYSCGAYLDPFETAELVRTEKTHQIQMGGWIARESTNFRFVGESRIEPFQWGRVAAHAPHPPAAAAPAGHPASTNAFAAGSNPHDEGVAEGQVAPSPPAAAAVAPARSSSMLPPNFVQSLPHVLSNRVGLFYTPSRSTKRKPGYEIGFTLANDTRGNQELVVSYYHHLVVRRNIKNIFEKKVLLQKLGLRRKSDGENRAINNYIDLGMEVVYQNPPHPSNVPSSSSSSSSSSAAAHLNAAPSLRFGASWQFNKNSLLKFRVVDSHISAMFALKSWWDPSASAALTLNHSFQTAKSSVGFEFELQNIGEVLFSRPDPSYRRVVSSQKEHIENLVELDEDY